jgi:uncharacterized protein with beta-barrel porin domain
MAIPMRLNPTHVGGRCSTRLLLTIAAVAGWSAAAQAGPGPCAENPVGSGVVTCSGNQSDGIDTTLSPPFPAVTTVLNVNSLTADITPPAGSFQPGILFFGSGDIALNSATGPFRIVISDDFTDGIVVLSDGAVTAATSGNISINGLAGNGINLSSFAGGDVNLTSSSGISLANGGGGSGIVLFSDSNVAVGSSGAILVTGDGAGISATAGLHVSVTSSGPITITGNGDGIDASDLGASAGGGGVVVNSSGPITLAGNQAIGINAFSEDVDPVAVTSSGQMTLSNGGNGILATGNGPITVNSSGGIVITGAPGAGIIAGSGGAGAVNVTSSGPISIAGDGAGIVAASADGSVTVASLGNMLIGGGGVGITAIGGTGATVASSGGISIAGDGAGLTVISGNGPANVTSSGSISLGGSGAGIGVFSDTGAVNVASSGPITIGGSGAGIDAEAEIVQVTSSGGISIGNGGEGITVNATTAATVNSSSAITLIGGDLSSGIEAKGGAVAVTSSGPISVTGGQFGSGIEATGTSVAVTSSGPIFIGGPFGAGIDATGVSVNVTSSANITAAAANSIGIQTEAAGGNIVVRVAGGTVTGGSGIGAGVALIGGGNNTLTNLGTITTSAGLAGTAILGMPVPGASPAVIGNNIVNNSGTVIGNVDLGPGHNAFNNLSGGTFITGASVKLGAGGALNNTGLLSPGGIGVIQTTALTGNLVQGNAGRIAIDVNPATSQADRINASGSATLGGHIALNLLNATPTTGATSLTLVHADAGAANNGVTLDPLPAVAAYQLTFPTGNDLVLQGGLNYAPPGLNANQAAIGQNINAIQLAGGSAAFQPIIQSILSIPDVSGLRHAYNQLSPELYGDDAFGDFYSGLRFANSLMSCKARDGRYAFIREDQCVWAQIGGKFLNLTGNSANLGFNESALVIAGGAEMMVQPDWFASFALGYDNSSAGIGGGLANSTGDRLHIGAAVKYNPGPYLFSLAVYGGYGWYSTDRPINFGALNATATSDNTISRVGGQFRAAYLIDRETWYVKPLIDLNLMRVNLNSFAEQGAGGANLIVSGSGQTVFSASPAVEIGAQTTFQGGTQLRPFAQLGLSVFSNTDFPVNAAFAGAPAGAGSFQVTTEIDTLTADVAAGADLFLPDNPWAFKLAYAGHYGSRVRDTGFRLKASIRF